MLGFYYDTQATTDDFRFMAGTNSAAATTGALSYALSGATTLGALGIRCNATLAADKWFIWRIELAVDGSARAYFGDETLANTTGLTLIASLKAGVVSATAFYYAHAHLAEQSTGDPTHSVDYFYQFGNRAWAA